MNLNIQDELGNTALHYAIDKKEIGRVYKLLMYGAKTNKKNVNDETPFDMCKN